MSVDRRLFQVAAAAACALCTTVAIAGDAKSAPAANETAPAMRAFIDPVTGEFRAPTAAESAALQSEAKSARKPGAAHPDFPGTPATADEAAKTLQQHADGSVSMLVPDELASNLVSHVGPGGRLAIHHRGADTQARPVTKPAAAQPVVEVADE